jgi:hypothetical protein
MSFVPNIKGDQILETIMTAGLTNPLCKPVRFAENLLGAEVVLSVAYQLESGEHFGSVVRRLLQKRRDLRRCEGDRFLAGEAPSDFSNAMTETTTE